MAAEGPYGVMSPGPVVWRLLPTNLALVRMSLKLPPSIPIPNVVEKEEQEKKKAGVVLGIGQSVTEIRKSN